MTGSNRPTAHQRRPAPGAAQKQRSSRRTTPMTANPACESVVPIQQLRRARETSSPPARASSARAGPRRYGSRPGRRRGFGSVNTLTLRCAGVAQRATPVRRRVVEHHSRRRRPSFCSPDGGRRDGTREPRRTRRLGPAHRTADRSSIVTRPKPTGRHRQSRQGLRDCAHPPCRVHGVGHQSQRRAVGTDVQLCTNAPEGSGQHDSRSAKLG